MKNFYLVISQLVFAVFTISQLAAQCPTTYQPVCGTDGKTYLNACYAETAGVKFYTEGICYADCVEPSRMLPNASCALTFSPVYGCNGVLYLNECEARKHGVVSWTPTGAGFSLSKYGQCVVQQYVYPPSQGVAVANGQVALNCPTPSDPVCGCNGITYRNACTAEALGVLEYTKGPCNDTCIDPSKISSEDANLCAKVYDPVCGCNGMNYINNCFATNAGIIQKTAGSCSTAWWRQKAIPLSCGDTWQGATSPADGNHLSQYPGCSAYSWAGPEKVFAIHKGTLGDLQIGMQILSAGLDLDLLLLDGFGNDISCLAESIRSNTHTKEAIVYQNAPIGTYYIVVDGQYATNFGAFELQMTCGYLDCIASKSITPGVPVNGNNRFADNNVIAYGCSQQGIVNIDNSGPEVMYSFVTTATEDVEIILDRLSANLELFLLDACNSNRCLWSSQNPDTVVEKIVQRLTPGTYYIVVDGYRGATGNYRLNLNYLSSCSLDLGLITVAGCNNTSSLTVQVAGGRPDYLVNIFGPVTRVGTSKTGIYQFTNLPSGQYFVEVFDKNGCTGRKQIQLSNGIASNGVNIQTTATQATCSQNNGSIQVSFLSGAPPFQLFLDNNLIATTSQNTYTITNLAAGSYVIKVLDANGCETSQIQAVNASSGNLSVVTTWTGGYCGQSNGNIGVDIIGGTGPFKIFVNGNLIATTPDRWYDITGLAPGTYTITIRDANGCETSRQQTVGGSTSAVSLTVFSSPASCNNSGSISLDITGGTPPFQILLNGNQVATTNNFWYTINNLASGSYTVKVIDANGCDASKMITVGGSGSNLSIVTTTTPAGCGSTGSIGIDIVGGSAPFQIFLNGTLQTTTNNRWYSINNLASGTYTVRVVDANWCETTKTVTVGGGSNLSIVTTTTPAGCGNTGSIGIDIVGGSAPFQIFLNGTLQTTTSNRWYSINNLAPGTYTVRVVDANWCETTKAVTVGGGSNLSIVTTTTPAGCGSTGSIGIDILGGTPSFKIYLNGNLITMTPDRWYGINDLAPGTYTVRVVDANWCETTKTVVITGASNLTITTTSAIVSCSQNNGAITVSINGGTAPFNISLDGNLVATTNDRNYTITGLAIGNYTVNVTDANGCSASKVHHVYGQPGIHVNTSSTVCGCGQSNGTISLDITGGTGPFQVFVNGNLLASTPNRNYVIGGLNPGSYTVRVVDANGCEDTSVQNVGGGAAVDITTSSTACGCGQSNGTITVDIAGGSAPFSIFVNGNLLASTSNRNYVIAGLSPGTYTVRVVDAHGCEDTNVQNVGGGAAVDITTSSTACGCGQSNGTITVDIAGGSAPFSIFVNGNLLASTSNRNYVIAGLSPGTYTVRVVDAHGCEDTSVQNVGGGPAVDITTSSTACGCGQSNGTITVDIAGGSAPFSIFVNGNLLASTSNRNYVIAGLSPGTYTVRVVDAHGCEDTSVQNVGGGTAVDITTSSTACGCGQSNGTITVDIAGGSAPFSIFVNGNLLASTSNRNYVIAGLSPGTYTVRVVDAHGCEDTSIQNVGGGPAVDITTSSTACGCGQSNGTITVDIAGGSAPFSIFVNGNLLATTNNRDYIIAGLDMGTYTIRVVDAHGCEDTNVQVVAGFPPVHINTASTICGCGLSNGTITVDIFDGTAPFQVFLDGNLVATTPDRNYVITGLSPGNYTVRVVDAHGCEDSKMQNVAGGPPVTIQTTAVASGCGQSNGSIRVDMTGGTAPFTIYLDGNLFASTTDNFYNIQNLSPGTYTVRVVDAHGCEDTSQQSVSGSGDIYFQTSVTNAYCGQSGAINLDIQRGTAPFSIYLNGALEEITSDSNYTIENLNPGIYTVRIVDDSGCEQSVQVTVGGSGFLNVNVTVSSDSCGGMNGMAILQINGGTAPFTIFLNGVAIDTITTDTFKINDLSNGNYFVKVVDVNGCFDVQSFVIFNTGQPPHAHFTYMIRPGGVIKFFADNIIGSPSWDFGDGTTSTDLNPVHTFMVGQAYVVCLTATNACGSDTFCDTIDVPDVYVSNLTFKMTNTSGTLGEMVEIPVKVENFDRVGTFQFSIQVENQQVARIVDITDVSLSNFNFSVVNDHNASISWTDAGSTGKSLPDGQTIFKIKVELTGARGTCTRILFTPNPTPVYVTQMWFPTPTQVAPQLIDADNVCVNNFMTISGQIQREDQAKVSDALVTCNHNMIYLTDAPGGTYHFDRVIVGSDVELVPEKDGEDRGGIDIADVVAVQRHLVLNRLLGSPFKIIAADANRDGMVNVQDLNDLTDLIKGDDMELSSGNSWRFVASDWQFANPQNPFVPAFSEKINMPQLDHNMSGQDFVGIKLGDVDGSFDMTGGNNPGNQPFNNNLTLSVENQQLVNGQIIEIPVRAFDFQHVAGFQFELNFDPSLLELQDVEPGNLPNSGRNNFAFSRRYDGVLTFAWYDSGNAAQGVNLASNVVLFTLKFKVKRDKTDFGNVFEIGNTITAPLGLTAADDRIGVIWNVENLSTGVAGVDGAAYKLYQNFPNPFRSETIIGFELPESEAAELTIFDQTGRVVHRTEGDFGKGFHQLKIQNRALGSPGVYYYRLTASKFNATRKMILE